MKKLFKLPAKTFILRTRDRKSRPPDWQGFVTSVDAFYFEDELKTVVLDDNTVQIDIPDSTWTTICFGKRKLKQVCVNCHAEIDGPNVVCDMCKYVKGVGRSLDKNVTYEWEINV
jgi:hypothetical protein